MTDQLGSSLALFKKALTDALIVRIPNSAVYESPSEYQDIMGTDGSGVGVWWLDETEVEYSVEVAMGGAPQQWDEVMHPTLVIQVIGLDTTDDQYAVDVRADTYLGHVIAILSSDQTAAIPLLSADNRNTYGIPSSARVVTGVDAQNMRGCRYELKLEVRSRITVEA